MNMDPRTEEKIRVRAHELWMSEGQPHGRHDEHWRQAATEISQNEANTDLDEDIVADTGSVRHIRTTTRTTRRAG